MMPLFHAQAGLIVALSILSSSLSKMLHQVNVYGCMLEHLAGRNNQRVNKSIANQSHRFNDTFFF